jgi:hypothetical protein
MSRLCSIGPVGAGEADPPENTSSRPQSRLLSGQSGETPTEVAVPLVSARFVGVSRLHSVPLDTTRGWAGEASSAEPRSPSRPQRRRARPALKNTASRRGRRPERPKSSAECGTADRPWHTVLNTPRGLSMISAETGASSAVFFTALTFSPLLCQDKRGTHIVRRSSPPTKKATRSSRRKTEHEHATRSAPPVEVSRLRCAPLDTTSRRAGEASSAEPRSPSRPQRRRARPALKNTASRRG